MRTVARDGETFYNEALGKKLQEAWQRSGVPILAVKELLGVSYETAQRYVHLKQSIVRSDVERKAVLVISMLNDMTDKGLLPVDGKYNSKHRTTEIFKRIETYIGNLEQ